MIYNMPMPLILLYLVRLENHVARFTFNVLRVLDFSTFDLFW